MVVYTAHNIQVPRIAAGTPRTPAVERSRTLPPPGEGVAAGTSGSTGGPGEKERRRRQRRLRGRKKEQPRIEEQKWCIVDIYTVSILYPVLFIY